MAVGIPLGPYRLVRRLATGGMAEIFLARQEGPDGFARELVVKRILPHLAADPEFTRMFRDEAKLAALLSHPNAVHLYDFGAVSDVDGVTLYLAMELVRGVDLRALILRALAEARRSGRSGAIPPHHSAKIASFVCEALAHAHSVRIDGRPAGIVHRDVTPSNVLLSFDGAVKLADFGIAKAASSTTERTEHGVVKGKHTYLSPEQARGEPLDARSDLFNVGILLFESVLGEALFPPTDQRLARRLSAAGELPRPERFERLPAPLQAIALKALSAHREDRYPDALALRSDLEAYLRSGAEPSDTVEIGRFVRQLCAEELSEDAAGPRAAGTVASTRQPGTAPLTGSHGDAGAASRARAGWVARAQDPRTEGTTPLTQAQAARHAAEDEEDITNVATRALSIAPAPDGHATDPSATSVGPAPHDDDTQSVDFAHSSAHAEARDAAQRDATEHEATRQFAVRGAVPGFVGAQGSAAAARGPGAPILPPTTVTMPTARHTRAASRRTGPRPLLLALGIVGAALIGALALVWWPSSSSAPQATLPRTASLEVRSSPEGARLFVDGVSYGVTPTIVSSITPGRAVRVEVRTATGELLDGSEITLGTGERRTLELRAAPRAGLVRVSTEPLGAQVLVDGEVVGLSPLERELPLGAHRVEVTLAGFAPEQDVVHLEHGGERASLSFTLRPVAPTVAVAQGPGTGAAQSPHTPPRRGTELTIREPRELPRSGVAGTRAPQGATGTLRVNTTPWSEVYEGGRRLGETPMQLELSVGRHVLTLRAQDRPVHTEAVEIRAGEVTRVRLIL